jgi:hypothetical protein
MCDSHDEFENLTELCFAVMATSDWTDDPGDQTRTLGNMQSAAIKYCEERLLSMNNWPIYVEDVKNPKCQVGIEQHFDVTLRFEDEVHVRYIGTIDGLVKKKEKDRWYLDENKTSVRLGDGWALSFDMSHQITGYCAASTAVFGFPVMKPRVTGIKIKPSGGPDDIRVLEPEERTAYSLHRWGQWVREMSEKFDRYEKDWEYAPRYTHSCLRYFRPCSLLPFCCDDPEGRQEAFSKQMVAANPTPSERGVVDSG